MTTVGANLFPTAPHRGRNIIRPGYWAQVILAANFNSVRRGTYITSTVVRDLRALPLLREPFLRYSRGMTAVTLNDNLHTQSKCVESAIMTVVGKRKEDELECEHCKEQGGPWARCVMLPGDYGQGLGCNNCHQLGRDARCEYYTPPAPGTATRPTRRRQPVPEQSQGPRFDGNAFSTELQALMVLAQDAQRRAREMEDCQNRGQVRARESRSLRRATDKVVDACRVLQRRTE